MKLLLLLTIPLLLIFSAFPISAAPNFILGEETIGFLQFALAPSPGDSSKLVLAEKETNRPDILCEFKRYRGGWDISNRHYWTSVGFTGAAGFSLAALWFISFGLALVVHICFKWSIRIRNIGSKRSLRICLILLLVFTCGAAIGCILLSVGQVQFHGEALDTLKYVVNQSDYTVQTLKNVTGYLSLAKSINVDEVFLPQNMRDDIDKLNVDLITAASTLTEKTNANSSKIKKVFNNVRSTLISVATVMLILSLLGLLFSIRGHQHAIYIFIFSGWLLVSVTFIFCGTFVILDNAISDTCVAMGEWVDNPQAETALSNILPCVDQNTTNKTLIQSKEVINQLVNVVNTAIYTFADTNPPPQATPLYYNQSGPLMPPLCSPFDSELRDCPCAAQEVSFANASLVWQNYTCITSLSGLCTNSGRITPKMYKELVAAVNVGYALEHYAPPLLSLQNCDFVRDTFKTITSDHCPPIEHYLKMVVAGLGLISVGVILCLVLWLLHANRPRREEVFAKHTLPINCLDISNNSSSRNNDSSFSNDTNPIL
ncbi:hypothetical protein GIB67_002527 [Kingdonia uniflora]|uniref:Uncharacterized protein n=1 Tax=Kingdonia uniflora TaxID=39325 RepID=A0A7J7N926_9MAGN|nr:hypothetical protein GIB67_002527 [Kingdonia uniflora]